jgi:hypothetical protein
MSIIEYCFGKIYRKKAQLIANKYQTQTFIKYIKKYMKKHCKLRTINMQETPELSHLIHINQYEYQYIIYFIQNNYENICNDLVNFYCKNKPTLSKYLFIYKPQYHNIRNSIDKECLQQMLHKYPINQDCIYIIQDIVSFASKLRNGFNISDVTAKTKIKEHWIERAPVLLLFTFFLLSIKLIHDVKVIILLEANIWTAIDIFISLFTFITAMYMVYLRVPQSICADANKAAGEIYFDSKVELHHSLLIQCDENTIKSYNNNIITDIICI